MSRHLSSEEISEWISGERTAEQERHLRECRVCAVEVEDMDETFSLFRESGERWGNHCYAERPGYAERPTSVPRLHLRTAVAMAACAVVCLMLLRPSPPRHLTRSTAEPPFIEMPYVAPLAPYERAEVVRMDVSVAALEAAGLDVRMPDAGASVLADVVLGQDGRAHAIRLVSELAGLNRRVSQ